MRENGTGVTTGDPVATPVRGWNGTSVGEPPDGGAQVRCHPGQLVDGGAGLPERLRRGVGGGGDAGDVRGDLRGPARGLLDRAGHLVGRGGLLFHGGGDGGLPVGDLRDDRGDLLDRTNGRGRV